MNAPCVFCSGPVNLDREPAVILRTPPVAHPHCFQESGEDYATAAARVQCCNASEFLSAITAEQGVLIQQWRGVPRQNIWVTVGPQTIAKYERGPAGVSYLGTNGPKKKEPTEAGSEE